MMFKKQTSNINRLNAISDPQRDPVQGWRSFRFTRLRCGCSKVKGSGLGCSAATGTAQDLVQGCTWTPKVCRIMAFMAVIMVSGLYFTYLWGLGRVF